MASNIQIELTKAVDLLKSHKISKGVIAEKLSLVNKTTKVPDHAILTKLCTGVIKSYNKKSIEVVYNSLIRHKDFKKYFSKELIQINDFDYIFFFYYFSYSEHIRFAVIGINEKSTSLSRLIYVEKNEQNEYKEKIGHHILSQQYQGSETMDLVCNSPRRKSGSTFLSIHLGDRPLEEINITFASYCGAMATDQNQYSGIGVIEKVDKNSFKGKIQSIADEGIKPSIINFLFRKRLDIAHYGITNDFYDDLQSLFGSQKAPLKLLAGYWKGYYLRRTLPGDADKTGGIIKVLLVIQPSGLASIKFIDAIIENAKNDKAFTKELEHQEIVEYSGIFKFPLTDSVSVTYGEFEYNKRQQLSRLNIKLKHKSNKLTGLLSGWRTSDLGYYATPIFFEKMTTEEIGKMNDNEILIHHKMTQYFRTTKNKFISQIEELKRIQRSIFESIEVCFD